MLLYFRYAMNTRDHHFHHSDSNEKFNPLSMGGEYPPTAARCFFFYGRARAAFAAADTIRPDETDLDDGFLSRAAEADAAATSGWGKEGISSVSQLASSHMNKVSSENTRDASGRKRKKCSRSTYILSTDPTDLSRQGNSTLATVR